jgi:hypothetical protein
MPMSMRWVIDEPHDSETVESLMASGLGWPVLSTGWYLSNRAWRASRIWSSDICSAVTSMIFASPEPTVCVVCGAMPVASSKVWATEVSVAPEAGGIDIFVPPSKSMPRVKPRSAMTRMKTTVRIA